MGIIKKLFGRELVGWSQESETEIYPITHVGAVYDENNSPLSNLLQSINQRISDVSGGSSHVSINYLWAFTVASTDSEAVSLLNVDEMADVIFERLDGDNNGYIEYEEFLRACIDKKTLMTKENLKYAFKFLDKDNSKTLDTKNY